jgi:hypothetical protein
MQKGYWLVKQVELTFWSIVRTLMLTAIYQIIANVAVNEVEPK